ncbi:MAG: zinc-binding dehydrogenase [Chloroflexota bacterium]|nr:zinc-binding dehydrogenase [Chloroflexota bacterium]
MKVKAMVLEAPRRMSLQMFDLPDIGPEDGLLKVEMVGVCGSDPGIYRGKKGRKPRPYPIIMGHEMVGEIAEIGDAAARNHRVHKGDRVIVEYAFGCGHCEACLKGDYTQCESNLCYGSMISCKDAPHLWGAYAEYMYIAPRAIVHKVSETLPPEAAILVCAVLGNAIKWLRIKGGVSIGDTVVIEGPGQQGLAGVIVARESGASDIIVTGMSVDEARLALAKEFGATYCCNIEKENLWKVVSEITDGKMADIVLEVTGHPQGLISSLDLVRNRGTIVMPGLYGMDKEIPLIMDKVIYKEVRVLGVFSHDISSVIPAIKLAESRKYSLERMVTHRFRLEEAERAVQVAGGEVKGEHPIKVVIIP